MLQFILSSGRKRITLTGKVINNSMKIIFLVAGVNKAWIIKDIFKEKAASYVIPASGNTIWMLDEKAAELIG